MSPPTTKKEWIGSDETQSPAPRLRSVVRKSALLNLTIFVTSFPVLVYEGGPEAIVPALEILAAISVLIWIVTFTLYFFVTLPRLFVTPISTVSRPDAVHRNDEADGADHWLA
jgi:hypothetical protein